MQQLFKWHFADHLVGQMYQNEVLKVELLKIIKVWSLYFKLIMFSLVIFFLWEHTHQGAEQYDPQYK